MRLWVVSDLHTESGRRLEEEYFVSPDLFDVLVCAGDVSNDIVESIETVAAMAQGKLAIVVAGNHDWWGDISSETTLHRGTATAVKHGVAWLERDMIDIGGVRFGGATLWDPLDLRYRKSIKALADARCDVVVTHFEPQANDIKYVGPRLWIYGHHHGFEDRLVGRTRLVRNAAPFEKVADGPAARPDFVVEV